MSRDSMDLPLLTFRRFQAGQASGNGNGGSDLLQQVAHIQAGYDVLWTVHARAPFRPIVLNLEHSWDILLTEGDFVSSPAADGKFRHQPQASVLDSLAHRPG